MAEIIKTSKEPVPAMRFIGKKYGDEDRVDGLFGTKWGEWFDSSWFEQLEKTGPAEGFGYYIGLMGHENGVFKYWIGMFMPAGTDIPEGFDYMDYPACHLGICRLKGNKNSIYCNEPMCHDRLKAEGYEMLDREFICFEREPLCDDPDTVGLQNDEVVLDICFFVK